MSDVAPPTDYIAHGQFTDPGEHAVLFDALPDTVESLCRVVQGLFIHDYYGGILYGPPPWGDQAPSRETLPVSERLDNILAAHDLPLTSTRPIFERRVGTCRDFALFLCAVLRQKKIPARVRCGFATYFVPGRYQDHWLTEYWNDDEGRWTMADAQIDDAHRQALEIDFPVRDVPDDKFASAATAWNLVRLGSHDPTLFGNGDDTGVWYMHMNLMRDALSLRGREVSDWDTWRLAPEQSRVLDAQTRRVCDDIAAGVSSPEIDVYLAQPPWL